MVLLGLVRLRDRAYGVPISREIEQRSGREVALGSVYAALQRLEENGLVTSKPGDRRARRPGQAVFPRDRGRPARRAGNPTRVGEPLAREASGKPLAAPAPPVPAPRRLTPAACYHRLSPRLSRLRKVPLVDSLRIIGRGSLNWLAERPIVVSFEVTDACTCWCKHCDHGGPRDESRNLKPADFRRYMEALRPCVVQVSGGEPMLRDDVVEIVRQIKGGTTLPYTILVSNWSLMTEEKYVSLAQAGIDQFSVSLDFPDERHDDFRVYPGLYRHLEDIVPRLAKLGRDDIVLNSCITSENVGEIGAIADKAREWGVNLCYSAYSARRTGCRDYFLETPEQLVELNRQLDAVEARRDATNWIVNAPTTLDATRRYFANKGTPGCKAGLRFLVVTADGALQPCSMQFQRYKLEDRSRMIAEFTRTNTCDECYVSIRSYLDKSFPQLLRENVSEFLSVK
jgi:MoaA/NifB/PqqE/SkfB family radical SAM enzyme